MVSCHINHSVSSNIYLIPSFSCFKKQFSFVAELTKELEAFKSQKPDNSSENLKVGIPNGLDTTSLTI